MSIKFKVPKLRKDDAKRVYGWLLTALLLTLPVSGILLWRAVTTTMAKHDQTTIQQVAAKLPVAHGPVHPGITTTVFWVGETADSENDYISNVPSAWQEDWQSSYGGVDDPDHRTGYLPAKFTPSENPFYFALPYGDLTEDGDRKPNSHACLAYTASTNDNYSWCKNVWIAIVYEGKTAYAQWEDVGPNEDNDFHYVFGQSKPRNTFGEKAGLDVSPAVRDYLNLDGSNRTSWAFIKADQVPDGPWKTVVTTNPGYNLNQ